MSKDIWMNAGFAVFVVFFGISVIEALGAGHWMRALLWIAGAGLFWWMGRRRFIGRAGSRTPQP